MAKGDFRIEMSDRELRNLLSDPAGPVARRLLVECGEIVLAGARSRFVEANNRAKSRPHVRTGLMRADLDYRIGKDDRGLYVDIGSYALNRRGEPYPRFVEAGTKHAKPRRSLRPALRDIRNQLRAQ